MNPFSGRYVSSVQWLLWCHFFLEMTQNWCCGTCIVKTHLQLPMVTTSVDKSTRTELCYALFTSKLSSSQFFSLLVHCYSPFGHYCHQLDQWKTNGKRWITAPVCVLQTQEGSTPKTALLFYGLFSCIKVKLRDSKMFYMCRIVSVCRKILYQQSRK